MSIKYEVSAVTGKYTDKDGNEKNRYTKVGVIIETRNGLMLKAEAIPIGWDGWAYLNEPRTDDKPRQESRPKRSAPADSFQEDSSVPF